MYREKRNNKRNLIRGKEAEKRRGKQTKIRAVIKQKKKERRDEIYKFQSQVR